MPVRPALRGRLHQQAAAFRDGLEVRNQADVDQMLAAWTTSYRGVRQDLDSLLAKVEAARAEGIDTSPAWLYQEQRLKSVLDTTRAQMDTYAQHASATTRRAAQDAIRRGLGDASELTQIAVAEDMPGLDVSFTDVNPEVLTRQVGFLADGTVLDTHLRRTMPAEAVDRVREALVRGVGAGWSQDRMVRHVTQGLALSHTRAVTILRTESLRAYRAASAATYQAQAAVLEGWVWTASLDSRCCIACAVQHGTVHSVTEVLDGHPRCRCAMVPRTKSWADLGVPGLDDTRPPIPNGQEWVQAQTPDVQRALMGPAKFKAWQAGEIHLTDMVARLDDPAWGTMRTERSLKAIREGRDANWQAPVTRTPDVTPEAPVEAPLPPSKYPQAELDRFARQLRDEPSVDLEHVLNQVANQKDPAVIELARREAYRRGFVGPLDTPAQAKVAMMNARVAKRNAERAAKRAELGSSEEWLAGLPRKVEGATAPAREVELANVSPAISQHLEGVDGVDVNGTTVHVTDHLNAAFHLERVLERFSASSDAMDQLRASRIRGYLDTIRNATERAVDDVLDTNPRFRESRAYQVNCTHVVSAYELRRRGYDVVASALPDAMIARGGRDWAGDIYRRWERPGATTEELNADVGLDLTKLQGERKMKGWGEGARATVRVSWKGGGAHVFCAEVVDGQVVYVDAQTGERAVDGYFARMRGKADWFRMDTRTPSPELEEMIVR